MLMCLLIVISALHLVSSSNNASIIHDANEFEFNKYYGYLLKDLNNPDLEDVRKIMKLIYIIQNPPKQLCKTKRLAIVSYASNNFEGIGSLLKNYMLGLSVSLHANRTYILGIELPYIFNNTFDIWAKGGFKKKKSSRRRRIAIIPGTSISLDCGNRYYDGGGPLSCFFEPLSSCSIEDLTEEDILQAGKCFCLQVVITHIIVNSFVRI